MTTERTGGLPPMDHGRNATDTKAAREEKQKVEKVREIDPDEEANRRRKKFQMMMGDEDIPTSLEPRAPSPFETEFYATATPTSQPGISATAGGSFGGTPDMGDVEDAIVPSPSYSPPPDVSAPFSQAAPDDESEDNLPQSSDFWDDVDFPPDQPLQGPQFQESPQSQSRTQPLTQQGPAAQAQPAGKPEKQGKGVTGKQKAEFPFGPPGRPLAKGAPPAAATPSGKKTAPPSAPSEKEKPPFFAPVKPTAKAFGTPPSKEGKGFVPADIKSGTASSKETKIGPAKIPPEKIEGEAKVPSDKKGKQAAPSEEEMPTSSYAGSLDSPQQIPALPPGRREALRGRGKEEEKGPEIPGPGGITREGMAPYKAGEPETGGRGGGREGREKGMEITAPSLPALPPDIQPIAQAAATQAAPYLRPETMSLFYQMVGTVYVMATPTGVSRTEIVLNNPAFADSKFYGSTITIEKYATAPDSFNIRLSGSDAAVTAFKDNIPSLMTAFQNGKYTFKINRLEAEHSAIKPVFRRKEKGEEGGFGGDLRDRSK